MSEVHWLYGFFLSGALGALIGMERSIHNREEENPSEIGGLRTFTLTGWFGWLCMFLNDSAPGIALVGMAVMGLMIVAVWWLVDAQRSEHGITTEIAYLVVWLLGAWVGTGTLLPPAIATVAVLSILGLKAPITAISDRLGRPDVYATIQFLLLAVVVLPLLPDRVIDPWGFWNPRRIGWLMVLISSFGFLGYLLTRFIRPQASILLVAAAGGLVSSTAVTLSYSSASNSQPRLAPVRGLGISLACLVLLPRALILITLVSPEVGKLIAAPFAATFAISALVIWWLRRQEDAAGVAEGEISVSNPFNLWEVFKYTALFAVIMGFAKVVHGMFGSEGTILTGLLGGIADVDAVSITVADQAKQQHLQASAAALGVLGAVISNTATKLGIALITGHRALRRTAGIPIGVMLFVLLLSIAYRLVLL